MAEVINFPPVALAFRFMVYSLVQMLMDRPVWFGGDGHPDRFSPHVA
jgi:hypothetical protein